MVAVDIMYFGKRENETADTCNANILAHRPTRLRPDTHLNVFETKRSNATHSIALFLKYYCMQPAMRCDYHVFLCILL